MKFLEEDCTLYDADYYFTRTSLEFTTELPDPLTPGQYVYGLSYSFDDFAERNCTGIVTIIDH